MTTWLPWIVVGIVAVAALITVSRIATLEGPPGREGATGPQGPTGSTGQPGGSVVIKGFTPTRPLSDGSEQSGHAYIAKDTGHLWVYNGACFIDVGRVRVPLA